MNLLGRFKSTYRLIKTQPVVIQSVSKLLTRVTKLDKMSLKYLHNFNKESFKEFVDSFDTVLTDCDGVLWIGNDTLPQAPEVMNKFKAMGKRVYYVTNNSTKSRDEFLGKFQSLGFDVCKEEIVSTAYLTALYLKEVNFNKKVFIIGSKGISQELDEVGIKHCGVGPEPMTTDVPTLIKSLKLDNDVGAVVVGFDEHFSLPKMIRAASYLSNPEILFIGTNTDERFPLHADVVMPGTGSFVNAISTCAERLPFIMGKPEAYICDAIIMKNGLIPNRTLMIGDRCNTDILLGTRCGFQTLLVLTGVTKLSEVTKWKESGDQSKAGWIPDLYTDKLGDLLAKMT